MAELRLVTYHSLDLGQTNRLSRHAVSEESYRGQLRTIVQRHHLMAPDELASLRTADDLRRLAMASTRDIYLPTFDDGYAEHPRAAELLAEAGGAGLFFVTSGTLQGATLLANKLHLLDLHAGGLPAALQALERAAAGTAWRDRLIDHGRRLLGRVGKGSFDPPADQAMKIALQELGLSEPLASTIDAALDAVVPLPARQGLYADDQALRQIVNVGSFIGGHGRTHRRLPLLDAADLMVEVQRSMELVARFHPEGPWHFAYPYGSHDAASCEALIGAGFHFLHTIEDGAIGPVEVDPYRLPRIDVNRLHAVL